MPSSSRGLCAVAIIGLVVAHLAAIDVRAQGSPIPSGDDPVLVENGTVTIRRSDFQRELERLPPEIRPGFSNSEKRINDLLRRLDEGGRQCWVQARHLAADFLLKCLQLVDSRDGIALLDRMQRGRKGGDEGSGG